MRPSTYFAAAERAGREVELESLCRETRIRNFAQLRRSDTLASLIKETLTLASHVPRSYVGDLFEGNVDIWPVPVVDQGRPVGIVRRQAFMNLFARRYGKPFNDCYGYGCGDQVILLVARLLRDECDPREDFVGHIGGDDFLVVFQSPDWRRRCERVMARFRAEVVGFYNARHRRGGSPPRRWAQLSRYRQPRQRSQEHGQETSGKPDVCRSARESGAGRPRLSRGD